MKLIIAEKPSVARAIAGVVGATAKKPKYHEGNGYLVSWAVGHLVELEDAAAYGDYFKWRIEDLPIVPDQWQYRVSKGTAEQFESLQQLMHRSDVDSLICATDAGREGELIFRLIYNKAGCTKPVERLWASSLEAKDLRAALDNLRPSSDYDSLYHAAQLRQQADWLVGINYSRFISCIYNHPLSVGRVQTPVLQLLARRQLEIDSFTPEPYYILTTQLGDLVATARVSSKQQAQAVIDRCTGQEAAITLITPEEHNSKAPALFCLSTLQGEANIRLGYTAQQTLSIAQLLYERQLITYPRTSSSYIPTSIQETLAERLQNLGRQPKFAAAVAALLTQPLPSIANDGKITDHHAIIPTMSANPTAVQLTVEEHALFELVCSRTIIALGEVHRATTVTVSWDIAGEAFKTTTRLVTQEGWRATERQLMGGGNHDDEPSADVSEQELTRPISESETYICNEITATAKKTQPPKAYTDRTLLEAMKNVGRRIGDDELREAIAGGLGTEATRASIIERLITMDFVQRHQKTLLPTQKGKQLLAALPWTEIKDAEMTAEWELMLAAVEHGEMKPLDFLCGITKSVASYITASKECGNLEPDPSIDFNPRNAVGKCPCCGGAVLEGQKSYYCEGKDFAIWKADAFWATKGKVPTADMVATLLSGGELELKDCTSKNGKTYCAKITLEGTEGGRARYHMEFVDKPKPTPPKTDKKPARKGKAKER